MIRHENVSIDDESAQLKGPSLELAAYVHRLNINLSLSLSLYLSLSLSSGVGGSARCDSRVHGRSSGVCNGDGVRLTGRCANIWSHLSAFS